MSGHELTVLAMNRLSASGPTDLAKKLGLRGYGQAPVKRVERWLKPNGDNPDYEGTIKLLDSLEAIKWEVLEEPLPKSAGAEVSFVGKQSRQARDRIEQRPIDPPDQVEGGSRT